MVEEGTGLQSPLTVVHDQKIQKTMLSITITEIKNIVN